MSNNIEGCCAPNWILYAARVVYWSDGSGSTWSCLARFEEPKTKSKSTSNVRRWAMSCTHLLLLTISYSVRHFTVMESNIEKRRVAGPARVRRRPLPLCTSSWSCEGSLPLGRVPGIHVHTRMLPISLCPKIIHTQIKWIISDGLWIPNG
jgi:hypothetical protein